MKLIKYESPEIESTEIDTDIITSSSSEPIETEEHLFDW